MDTVILARVEDFCTREGLLQPGTPLQLAAAVSGGADSMALLLLLRQLQPRFGYTLSACHVNHGLRGQSADRDEAFVRAECARLGVPLRVFHAAELALPPAHAGEDWARRLRYTAFVQLQGQGIDAIATAHTANDQAETLLLRLARGTGLHGAGGIRPRRGCYLRPLLCLSRAETEAVCRAAGQPWVTDETNDTDAYARNRLRHSALPALESTNAAAVQNLARFCEKAARADAYLAAGAAKLLAAARLPGAEPAWQLALLQAADPLLLETALHSLVAPVRDAEEKYVQLLCAVVRQGSGAVQLTGQVRFCAGNGCLRQETLPQALPEQPECLPQQVPFLPEKQPEFRLFFGQKGHLLRQALRLLGQRLRQRFLPQTAVPGAKAYLSGQLYCAAALPHHGTQQLHIFFLCVPHRGYKAVQRGLQQQRICRLQKRQLPRRFCAGQACRRQKLCSPGGKVGICSRGLFTEPCQILHRCRVGAFQRRQGAVAQPVAGVGIGVVGLVGDPRLPRCPADGLGLGAAQAEQRAQVAPTPWPDAARTVQPGAARQPQQQRFGLVICSMGRGDGIYPLSLQLHKGRVAQTACPVLPGVCRGQCQLCGVEHPQRHAQAGAFSPHKGFVPVGALPAQTVVHMAGRERIAEPRLQLPQQKQQRHAVCPAGDCRRQLQRCAGLQKPLPGAEILHPGKNHSIHQRLKSTSIKRVWAPSQPSGTVLVSP